MAKIDIVSLIIVRFSIRNHRWKAENLSFFPNLSDLTLLERPAPLLKKNLSYLSSTPLWILPLRVETGRFVNENRCDRICTFYNSGEIEVQIHFLFRYNLYEMQRNEIYVKARNIIERWDELSDIHKLASLGTWHLLSAGGGRVEIDKIS